MPGFFRTTGSTGQAPTTSWFGTVPDRLSVLERAYLSQPLGLIVPAQGQADLVSKWNPYNQNQQNGGSNVLTSSFGASAPAPDGTNNAIKLVESATNTIHAATSLFETSNISGNYILRLSVFAKAGERTRFAMSINSGFIDPSIGLSAGCITVFDLAGGQIAVPNTAYNSGAIPFVPKGQEIVSFGSGWYRCTMDVKTGQGVFSGMNFAIELDNGAGTGAMSNSYAGDGTSGAYFWRSTCLPPAAWDLHTVTFFDDFTTLNTIDIHDTKAPGFNWYVDPNWPNYLTGLDVTGPTNYSINSSVLTTDATALAAGHYVLPISAVYTSGGNWNGFVFTPSVLLEASQATQQVRPGQMSFWTHSLAFLLSANPPNGWHIENDFYEYPPGGGLLPRITFAASPDNVENTLSSAPNYEAWQPTEAYTTTVFVSYLGVLYQANTNPTVGVPPPTAEWTTVSPQPPSHTEVDYTQQNITQTLWLAAGNGDVGQVLSFFNNSFIPTIHFIYGRQIFNVPGPGVPSPLPIYFFIGDGLPGPVILQTNGGFKTFWGFVRVTQ